MGLCGPSSKHFCTEDLVGAVCLPIAGHTVGNDQTAPLFLAIVFVYMLFHFLFVF